jgi:hypothetical protein
MRKRKEPNPDLDPDLYLWLMDLDLDPDPRGPKTCDSRSVSGSESQKLDCIDEIIVFMK